MKRTEFLHTVSGGFATVCVSCLTTACSKNEEPTPNAVSTPVTNKVFTVKLDSELKSINDFIAKSGIIVIRLASGNAVSSFLAVSSACPHASATVEYISKTTSFYCSAHGSTFGADGSLISGPAPKGLTKLVVEITGTTLTVK
jgi:cytochrome b6-f complex iron-sulfur subunit